jgi:hypothetical protein
MPHVVLMGDSVFDNAAYVPGEADVCKQLRRLLPAEWKATLLAVDGSVVADVSDQLAQLPADATHLAISAGGNDALRHSSILYGAARSVSEALSELAGIQDDFRRRYRAMLQSALQRRLPTIVLTIYDAVPGLQREAVAALSVFNDVIVNEAARSGVSILDLRLVCTEARHFSALSPIEPSAFGGQRIAEALARAVRAEDSGRRSVIF